MILVDNQGDFSHVIWPLAESPWDGVRCIGRWTCFTSTADLIFPAFLFIMGVSIVLASRAIGPSPGKALVAVLRRGGLLYIIGVLFAILGSNFHPRPVHLFGVLQRLGICYLACSGLYTYLGRLGTGRMAAARGAVLLGAVLYQALMLGVANEGCARGSLDPLCNTEYSFNKARLHFAAHTVAEGLISTLTSIGTTWLGVEAGVVLSRAMDDAAEGGEQISEDSRRGQLVKRLLLFSASLIALSWVAAAWTPINKKLWSVPFALFSAGTTCLSLSLSVLLWERPSSSAAPRWFPTVQRATSFLRSLGRNPLAVFLGMVLLETILLDNIKVKGKSAYAIIFDTIFASWMGNRMFASLVFSLVHLALWVAVAVIMDRRKVYVKL